MSIFSLIATLIYKRNDILTSMSISLLIILLKNPFALFSIGLQLSYLGTIGICVFYKRMLDKFRAKNKELYLAQSLSVKEKLYKKIIEIILVTISAQFCILPIILYNFNNLSITFLISNILANFVIGPILIFGFLLIIFNFIFYPLATLIVVPLKLLLKILITISNFVGNLPLSHILIPTPSIMLIILYYFLLLALVILTKNKLSTLVESLCRYVKRNKRTMLITSMVMCITVVVCGNCNKKLNLYFIDVGQGDSTLIVTPNNKKILIDGGGSANEEFDVGKSTLVPYLLHRGIKTIDYIIVSHFDLDHVRTEYLQ